MIFNTIDFPTLQTIHVIGIIRTTNSSVRINVAYSKIFRLKFFLSFFRNL